jgi:ubiquinone/menaquinone biosynthesis C-methylase UbiE
MSTRRAAVVVLAALVGAAAAALGAVLAVRRGRGAPGADAEPAVESDLAALVPVLACVRCGGALTWDDAATAYACDGCARTYPVQDGIVHMIEQQDLTGQNRRFAHLYDRFAWAYALFSRGAFALGGMTEERGRREVLDRLEPRGGRVLDVSTGPGSNLPGLLARPDVGEVHALDISLGQLRRARSLVRRRGWRVPLYLANAEALPFRDATFDAVVHVGGINFFDDKKRAVAEMARVARPGARVVIVDEKERAARTYERTIPGFRRSFANGRPAVVAPVDLVPPGMADVRLTDVWRGLFYCLEFVKPDDGAP